MKWPLKWYHWAVRETVCWLWGHDWKYPARPKVRDHYPPGWTQRTLGNPYFETVSSWEGKCRRCRERTDDEPYHPLWREIGWMLRHGFNDWWIGVTVYYPRQTREPGFGYSVVPWWVWLVGAVLGAPAFAFEQVWFGWFSFQWGWPGFIGQPASWLHMLISEWQDSKATHYRWMPPQDPNDKNEIGFWLRQEDADRMEATGEWRTRVWVHAG